MSPHTLLPRALVRHCMLAALALASVVALEVSAPPAAEARSGGSGGGFSGGLAGRGFSGRGFSGRGFSGGGGSGAVEDKVLINYLHALGVLIAIASIFANWRQSREAAQAKAEEALTIGRIQLAFNAARTAGLRKRIEEAVRTADVSVSAGIYRLSLAVTRAVEWEQEHISHAGFFETEALPRDEGEPEFRRLTSAARRFYDREVIRRDASGLTERARNSSRANELLDEDGDFGIDEFFVVTLFVCVDHGRLALPTALGGPDDIQSALSTILTLPAYRLIGFEVVWTPAAESDILTRDELFLEFSDLAPL